MRNPTQIPILVLIAWIAFGGMSPIVADPSDLQSTSAEPTLPDPLPYTGPDFSAASATAGTADPGPALESLKADNRKCSALNPCAVPSPALMTSAWDASGVIHAKESQPPKSPSHGAGTIAQH